MTPTAASSRCSPTLLWKFQSHNFEKIIDEMKAAKGVKMDTELDADDLKDMVERFKAYYKEQNGADFPQRSERAADGSGQGRVPLLG